MQPVLEVVVEYEDLHSKAGSKTEHYRCTLTIPFSLAVFAGVVPLKQSVQVRSNFFVSTAVCVDTLGAKR